MLGIPAIFSGPYALLARFAVVGILALSCMGFGAWKMHEHMQGKVDAVQHELDVFRGGVKALGEAAEKVKQQTEAQRKKDKEDADKTLDAVLDTGAADLARMRKQRDDARRSVVPSAPADTKRPDLACYDRAILEQGMGENLRGLREAGRGLADKGATNTVRLAVGSAWALKLSPELSK